MDGSPALRRRRAGVPHDLQGIAHARKNYRDADFQPDFPAVAVKRVYGNRYQFKRAEKRFRVAENRVAGTGVFKHVDFARYFKTAVFARIFNGFYRLYGGFV